MKPEPSSRDFEVNDNSTLKCPGNGLCNGKGICDMDTGICNCFNNYYGNACECKNWFILKLIKTLFL